MRTLVGLSLLIMSAFLVSPSLEAQQDEGIKTINSDFALIESETPRSVTPWSPFWGRVMMYIPNRVVDFTDIFTLELGLGANFACNVYLTRACVTGLSYGQWFGVAKDYNRQVGSFIQEGWNANFMFAGETDVIRDGTTGSIQPYWLQVSGVNVADENIFVTRTLDYNAIGFDLGCLANVNVYIHPRAIYDFLAGIIMLDPDHDDFVATPAPID